MECPFELRESEKYCCIALQIPFLDTILPKRVSENLLLVDSLGDRVLQSWVESIGKLKHRQLSDLNFCIVAHQLSDRPQILDGEHSKLERLASDFLCALVLADAKMIMAPVYFLGSRSDGITDIKSLWYGRAVLRSKYHPFTALTEDCLKRITAAARTFEYLLGGTGEYSRFRRGIDSYYSALVSTVEDERLFYFCRSLEALFGGVKSEGKSAFVDKASSLTVDPDLWRESFEKLYEVRNNYVHVNDTRDIISNDSCDDNVPGPLELLCINMQIFVLELFLEILENEVLLRYFSSDISVRDVWKSGLPIQIDIEALKRDRNAYVLTMPYRGQ